MKSWPDGRGLPIFRDPEIYLDEIWTYEALSGEMDMGFGDIGSPPNPNSLNAMKFILKRRQQ
jgi:hypothetical protein